MRLQPKGRYSLEKFMLDTLVACVFLACAAIAFAYAADMYRSVASGGPVCTEAAS